MDSNSESTNAEHLKVKSFHWLLYVFESSKLHLDSREPPLKVPGRSKERFEEGTLNWRGDFRSSISGNEAYTGVTSSQKLPAK